VAAVPLVQKRCLIDDLGAGPQRISGEPDPLGQFTRLGDLRNGQTPRLQLVEIRALVLETEAKDQLERFIRELRRGNLTPRNLEIEVGEVPTGQVLGEIGGAQHQLGVVQVHLKTMARRSDNRSELRARAASWPQIASGTAGPSSSSSVSGLVP
jgi:hypothetical protein